MISKKPLDISFIRRQILLTISVTPLCSPWTRMTPAHVINNFTSVNSANLLRLMSCLLKSLTTSLCSIFWIVKASARPFRSLSFLTASCMFILFADLAQNHVPNGASLQVTLRFAQEEELKPVFSPLLNGPDLWQSILMWELQLLVSGWLFWEKIIGKSKTIVRNIVQKGSRST